MRIILFLLIAIGGTAAIFYLLGDAVITTPTEFKEMAENYPPPEQTPEDQERDRRQKRTLRRAVNQFIDSPFSRLLYKVRINNARYVEILVTYEIEENPPKLDKIFCERFLGQLDGDDLMPAGAIFIAMKSENQREVFNESRCFVRQ